MLVNKTFDSVMSAQNNVHQERFISIAPMMRYTDRHFRYLMRLMSQHVWLYTEMVTTGALLHNDPTRWLRFHPAEHPIALQLGGSDPQQLAQCAQIAQTFGYDEVNLNVGCPSDRVQAGRFGACLMAEPDLVADCVAAMQAQVNIPVTVKTRIGIDDHDSYEYLQQFIQRVAQAGCHIFMIHARKAWLTGLNPKQNRTVPPLRYDIVCQLKRDFPQLTIILNGGIIEHAQIEQYRDHVDGFMIGRAAYENPYLFAEMDQRYFNQTMPALSRQQIVQAFLPYMENELIQGTPLAAMTRHLLLLFRNQPGGKAWRRYLSTHTANTSNGSASINDIKQALLSMTKAEVMTI
ncbi:MAG: tRNA dihydrouridine(20/20a) synthase DusA [Gammaproteobacteria bacterium]